MLTILLAHLAALLFSFFVAGVLLGVLYSQEFRRRTLALLAGPARLVRSIRNPLLSPGATPWTAEAVFNPAALVLQDRTHLVYRAIGMDGVSRLGYAGSPDGITFDDRPAYPIFSAPSPRQAGAPRTYSPVLYPSGGSWGGCEDPRMTRLDGRIYLTYNAFDGWDYIRTAYTSISEADFLAKRFYGWRAPKLLSPSGERHKSWVLFPERFEGRYAILHNMHAGAPDRVAIAYLDDLEHFDPDQTPIRSADPNAEPPQQIAWHYRMRSAGAPPLRTDRGWLIFYHAMSSESDQRYKLGAALLDLEDPSRVLYRAAEPVLTPDMTYENAGKPGVIYACGATIRDGTLFVYYGGADKVVCVATAPLAEFLDALVSGNAAPLSPAPLFAP